MLGDIVIFIKCQYVSLRNYCIKEKQAAFFYHQNKQLATIAHCNESLLTWIQKILDDNFSSYFILAY